jgi:uncharacterized protein YukE
MKFRTLRLVILSAPLLACISSASSFAQEQSSSPAPAATPTGTSAAPNPTPTKRVWTNEDMGDLHQNSSISTFSGSGNKPTKTSEKPTPAVVNKDAKRYQDQITTLRAKLPDLDDKISQLKGVLNGDTVQSTRTYGGARIDDWHEELLKLQKQRDDIQTKISSLQDEARHKGVPENQIPQ